MCFVHNFHFEAKKRTTTTTMIIQTHPDPPGPRELGGGGRYTPPGWLGDAGRIGIVLTSVCEHTSMCEIHWLYTNLGCSAGQGAACL